MMFVLSIFVYYNFNTYSDLVFIMKQNCYKTEYVNTDDVKNVEIIYGQKKVIMFTVS